MLRHCPTETYLSPSYHISNQYFIPTRPFDATRNTFPLTNSPNLPIRWNIISNHFRYDSVPKGYHINLKDSHTSFFLTFHTASSPINQCNLHFIFPHLRHGLYHIRITTHTPPSMTFPSNVPFLLRSFTQSPTRLNIHTFYLHMNSCSALLHLRKDLTNLPITQQPFSISPYISNVTHSITVSHNFLL